MKQLIFFGFLAFSVSQIGTARFIQPASAQSLAQSGQRFVYIHRKIYQHRTPTIITTCNCYLLSYSAWVQNGYQVGRYASLSRAIAVRNVLARRRSTCPGKCRTPLVARRRHQPRHGACTKKRRQWLFFQGLYCAKLSKQGQHAALEQCRAKYHQRKRIWGC